MACGEEVVIVRTRLLSAGHRGNHRCLAGRQERFDHPLVGFKGLVGQQSVGSHLRKENVGAFEIMSLARR